MRILVVGQSPSKRNKDKGVPFEGTRSGINLWQWLETIDPDSLAEFDFVNCSDEVDYKFKPKDIEDIAERVKLVLREHRYDKIITLGKVAGMVMDKAGIKHYSLPHPSGLNRKLNDKTWLAEQVQHCKSYVWS
jgi:uracil-DNA glycosylase